MCETYVTLSLPRENQDALENFLEIAHPTSLFIFYIVNDRFKYSKYYLDYYTEKLRQI